MNESSVTRRSALVRHTPSSISVSVKWILAYCPTDMVCPEDPAVYPSFDMYPAALTVPGSEEMQVSACTSRVDLYAATDEFTFFPRLVRLPPSHHLPCVISRLCGNHDIECYDLCASRDGISDLQHLYVPPPHVVHRC